MSWDPFQSGAAVSEFDPFAEGKAEPVAEFNPFDTNQAEEDIESLKARVFDPAGTYEPTQADAKRLREAPSDPLGSFQEGIYGIGRYLRDTATKALQTSGQNNAGASPQQALTQGSFGQPEAANTFTEAAVRGTGDLYHMLVERPANRILDIGAEDPVAAYHARLLNHLNWLRNRHAQETGQQMAVDWPEGMQPSNPAAAELGSVVLDPTVLAPGIKLPASAAKLAGRGAAKAVAVGSKALEQAGAGINRLAKLPEQAVSKVLPKAEGLMTPAAIAGAAGLGGPVTGAATGLKAAQAAGATAEKVGQFGQELAKTSGTSQFGRFEQIAMSEGAPAWVRGAARNLSRLGVDKVASEAADLGASAAKGAVIGGAFAAPAAISEGSLDEFAQGAGGGLTFGSLAHVAFRPFASGIKKRAAEDADIVRWFESKPPEEQAALGTKITDRTSALRTLKAEALINGVLTPNANVKFQYLSGPEFEAQFGRTRGVQVIQGEVPSIILNTDAMKDRTVYHELFHALDSIPSVVDFGSLSRLLFDTVDDAGQPITKGLLSNEDLKKLGDQYFSRFDEPQRATWKASKDAFEANPLAPEGQEWKTRMSREVAAELFANLSDDAPNLVKDAGSLSRRVLDSMIQSDSKALKGVGKFFTPEPKAQSDIFPGLKATPEVYAAFRDAVRKKGELIEKPTFDPEATTDVSIDPADALKPGGEKIVEAFADNDVFKKAPDGSVMYVSGRPVLLTEREIKSIQADRAKAISDALAKVPDDGDATSVRPVDGGFEGKKFSDAQLAAIEAIPGNLLTPSMKAKIRKINDLVAKGDGSPILMRYNAATKAGKDQRDPVSGLLRRGSRKYSSKISESVRVVTPIGVRVTKAGNYTITGLDVTAFSNKLNRWTRDKKRAFKDFDGQDHFVESAMKYLENHQNKRPGETGLDADGAKALRMKRLIKDFFNITDAAWRENNPGRISTSSDKDNLIRSFRFDRINKIGEAAGDKFPVDVQLQKQDFSPDVETPEFKKWFAGSKVVDAEGKPLRVFHASTYGDFTKFDPAEQRFGKAGYGFYFSDAAGANRFAEYGQKFQMDQNYRGDPKQVRIYPTFLKMENPLVVDHVDDLRQFLDRGQTWGAARGIGGNLPPEVKTRIQQAGYDGIIARETVAPKTSVRGGLKILDRNDPKAASLPVYVVFDPSQIKSAIGNVGTFDPKNPDIRFSPDAERRTDDEAFSPDPSIELRKLSDDYAAKRLPNYKAFTSYEPVPEDLVKTVADAYAAAKHQPDDLKTKAAYQAFADETLAQWDYLTGKGVRFEPWTKEGQPYATSADMTKDVRENKHLWFFPTQSGFGSKDSTPTKHPLLSKAGMKVNGVDLTVNDVFRAVHDYFGHAKENYEFGPRGEYNAFLTHFSMFSDAARPAMASETLGQNSWVNFGPHIRRPDGTLPKKGEEGFVPLPDRPFAEQKATLLPDDLVAKATEPLRKTAEPQDDAMFSAMPVQYEGEPLPHSVGSIPVHVIHFTSSNLLESDPRKLGKAFATKWDLRGDFKSFFFVAGSPLGRDQQFFGNGDKRVYAARISGTRLYDLSEGKPDPLNWSNRINRVEADEDVQKAGYAGILVDTGKDDGRKVVLMFQPVKLTELPAPGKGITTAPKFGQAPEKAPEGEELGKIVSTVLDLHAKNGGSTFTPAENRSRTGGEEAYVVSIYPERSQALKDAPTAAQMGEFVTKNWDLLRDPKNSIGTWHDKDSGQHYVDVSVVTPDRKRAIDLGKQYNQKAVWDLKNSEAIDTGGTGETRAGLPPEDQRALYSPDTEKKKTPAPTFYSTLQKVVDQKIKGESIPAAQLAALLRNPQSGVKAEELKWSGLEAWLQGKAKVTKAEVTEFLKGNELKIEEVQKGAGPDLDTAVRDYHDLSQKFWDESTEYEKRIMRSEFLGSDEGKKFKLPAKAKFDEHQLPGGENYRELLFTLPERTLPSEEAKVLTELPEGYELILDRNQPEDRRWGIVPPGQVHARPFEGSHPTQEAAIAAALGRLNREAQYAAADRKRANEKGYKSSHWDESNVLGHTRVNERTTVDGKKVLFLEELQSDWHQEGRKKGYRDDSIPKQIEALDKRRRELEELGKEATPEQKKEWAAVQNELRALRPKAETGVPEAPFAKTWHEFLFKRMVREAAEKGFDWLGWTPGEVQAARYDLSKQVDVVHYNPETRRLTAEKDSSRVIDQEGVTPEKLEDFVGKEVAQRLMSATPNSNGLRSLAGEGLKVGGAGMKGFYDKIIPDFARKFAKKWGAEVKEISVPDADDFTTESFAEFMRRTNMPGREVQDRYMQERQQRAPASLKVWGMQITPEMRDSVVYEGQPMFSAMGDPSPAKPATEERRMATRVPRAVKSEENALTGDLRVDVESMKKQPDYFKKVVRKLASYPLIRNVKGSVDNKAKAFMDRVVDNLLWLHDNYREDLRTRAKLWYDGARVIVDDTAKEYGYPAQAVAAAIAVTSPQRDWFQNVSIGRRIVSANKRFAGQKASPAYQKWVAAKDKTGMLVDEMGDKRFEEMSPLGRAAFLRAFEALDGDNRFNIILPEGELADFKRNKPNKKGEAPESKIVWGSFDQLAKAFRALDDPSFETISKVLGNEHKVRNFYNNMMFPTDAKFGDVTIDTHAVAAGLLLPVAGMSKEVVLNFGSTGTDVTGTQGSYGLYADAYRTAAEKRNVLPREMQSITWEAVRGLFEDTWKTPANYALVQNLWKEYSNGSKTANEVREAVIKAAGGIKDPDWVGKPARRIQPGARVDETAQAGPNPGKLPDDLLRGSELPADRGGGSAVPAAVP